MIAVEETKYKNSDAVTFYKSIILPKGKDDFQHHMETLVMVQPKEEMVLENGKVCVWRKSINIVCWRTLEIH